MAGACKNGLFLVAHAIGSREALVLQVGVATGGWVTLGDQRQRQRQLPKLPTAASLEREAPTSINNRCCAHARRPCLSHNLLSLGDVAMAFQVRLRIPPQTALCDQTFANHLLRSGRHSTSSTSARSGSPMRRPESSSRATRSLVFAPAPTVYSSVATMDTFELSDRVGRW